VFFNKLLDPELAMEESDAWRVYQNQEPLITSLETLDTRFSKFQEILKKYGICRMCTLPLTAAHSKVGMLALASKTSDVYLSLAWDLDYAHPGKQDPFDPQLS
jgi:hypothetical protein